MKKIYIYTIVVILTFFTVPIIFTTRFKKASTVIAEELKEEIEDDNSYDYGKYETIKLLHSDTGEVEQISLDDYICNVVSAEMPVSYEKEALKAQAVVARTYTIYKISKSSKHKNDDADICDDSGCCQAWISKEDRMSKWSTNQKKKWKKIQSAVNSTEGKIITYDGEVINAFFHANSGGMTEIPLYVWGGTGYPYLQSVETSSEDEYKQYSSEVTITRAELKKKMKAKYSDFKINYDDSDCIEIKSYTESRRVKKIKIGNKTITGVEARTIFGLRSAMFSVSIGKNNIKFSVTGYGHGVGMSQTGSNTLAKEGKTYSEIIKYYYKDVEVENANFK